MNYSGSHRGVGYLEMTGYDKAVVMGWIDRFRTLVSFLMGCAFQRRSDIGEAGRTYTTISCLHGALISRKRGT